MHFRAMMGRQNRQVSDQVPTEFQPATTGGSLPQGARDDANLDKQNYMIVSEGKGLRQSSISEAAGSGGFSRSNDEVAVFLRNVVSSVAQLETELTANDPFAQPRPEASTSESVVCGRPLWKRSFDVAIVLLTLPLWLPVVSILALWIAITSPGPIFYRQARIGYRGCRFMILKFRTMKVNAETKTHEAYLQQLMANDAPMIKLDAQGDPRLIFGGRILRALGLDELPQIFNVLKGEMSLIGPRPCTVSEFEHYEASCRARVAAFPGITGYWQVNGKNKTTFRQMIEMDIYYARNLSFALDMRILLRTFPAIFGQVLDAKPMPRSLPAIHAAAK